MSTFVNVYEVGQNYGGPEEGGWWYETGHCIATYLVNVTPIHCEPGDDPQMDDYGDNVEHLAADGLADELRQFYPETRKRYSVLGGDDWIVRVSSKPGKDYPEVRPHYE